MARRPEHGKVDIQRQVADIPLAIVRPRPGAGVCHPPDTVVKIEQKEAQNTVAGVVHSHVDHPVRGIDEGHGLAQSRILGMIQHDGIQPGVAVVRRDTDVNLRPCHPGILLPGSAVRPHTGHGAAGFGKAHLDVVLLSHHGAVAFLHIPMREREIGGIDGVAVHKLIHPMVFIHIPRGVAGIGVRCGAAGEEIVDAEAFAGGVEPDIAHAKEGGMPGIAPFRACVEQGKVQPAGTIPDHVEVLAGGGDEVYVDGSQEAIWSFTGEGSWAAETEIRRQAPEP